jgi:hypothetical protein
MKTLTDQALISSAITPAAGVAGTADIEGTIIDMKGYDSVLMIAYFGAITGGAVTTIKARQGADSGLSDAADIEGSSQTVADDDDNEIFFIDLKEVQKRYVQLYVDRGTANAVVGGAVYLRYNARRPPVTQTVNGEKVNPAVAGTA